ncbi:ThiF family adenylyltransferase [Calidifontibacillus erzurumensis]|uniref:ThiF family adenylyltransferase n=1 Tax=Calidifontibacillus erzurumensis TaxID=2741433 RepID=A0A8J8GBE5_9BACI|nr:ThiF family adenylyltransferase [Calidifontibacillus erzurumensis]NSL50337.1 ThiF family adenylyltransferase [Calidifontibacillus erzurumensis]
MSNFTRYSRQILFSPIGEEGQQKLLNSSVLIVGMGALGTALANHLVRAGVGFVRFVDRDYVEMSNLQRQMLFDEEDVTLALPKAIAAKRKLSNINSSVQLDAIVADVSPKNIEELLDGIDIVVDGTDNFQTRFLLNDACFKKGIPFVYGGAVSSRGMSAIFVPYETPCLRCFISSSDQGGQTCDTIGVISPIIDIIASLEAVEVLKFLVGDQKNRRTSLLSIDIWNNYRYEMKFSAPRSDCPTCQKHEYPALDFSEKENVTVLCGRETVQIHVADHFNLEEWFERFQPIGKVQKTPFLLKIELPEGERLVLFPDGRVLVQGTEDEVRAKTLYARYIGL